LAFYVACRVAKLYAGVFNRRIDEKFGGVLRQWDAAWKAQLVAPKSDAGGTPRAK